MVAHKQCYLPVHCYSVQTPVAVMVKLPHSFVIKILKRAHREGEAVIRLSTVRGAHQSPVGPLELQSIYCFPNGDPEGRPERHGFEGNLAVDPMLDICVGVQKAPHSVQIDASVV